MCDGKLDVLGAVFLWENSVRGFLICDREEEEKIKDLRWRFSLFIKANTFLSSDTFSNQGNLQSACDVSSLAKV